MTYIKINDTVFPATIVGKITDSDWDDRSSKSIILEMSHADASSIFTNGVKWVIRQDNFVSEPILDEAGKPTGEYTEKNEPLEFDNSEYSLAGDIIDHRDGTITVKMGKPTDLENALEMLLNTQEG